ncbi:three-Cys-motif partner protein TcmP [Arenibacter sp. F20364]|jgi:three-Cys-motif partner protein|uniref:three-Cys-motif partner protein TcmP n=1 Tax=Arenibacter sp. F20364 TaxID=2926415 RepID=UPI001FF542CD|nr:three-Cys-motif partner protein TcmP [Arenibacter sp. F20364]MCK0192689.1 three-Cys-motif partner protein TcmP [Arenibacter sp. F20364]
MPGISLSDFFKEKRTASEIKSEILNEYFKAWAAILLKGQQYRKIERLVYVDLFSGPGLYDDGKPSTPIKILNSINQSKGQFIDFDNAVKTFFNDKSERLANDLKENIENLPYYDEITHKPVIANEPASQKMLEEYLQSASPSLTFIDPLGYNYTQNMLLYSVKNWGSDLFMLFNFNRIRAAIRNKKVKENMQGIFSSYYDEILEFYKKEERPHEREEFIIKTFQKIFADKGYYILKFKVNFPNRNQTSHYLFFISKVHLAITRAKEIMTKYSDIQDDGVPLFGANLNQDPLFFPSLCEYSVDELSKVILRNVSLFDQKTIEEIYREHNYSTNYIKQNYKDAIEILVDSNKIALFDKKGNPTMRMTYTAKIKFI